MKCRAAAAVVLAVLAACGGGSSSGGRDGHGGAAVYRLDGALRLNQIQVLGTHNSYHVAPPAGPDLTPDRNITQPPLEVQLDRESVRQVELDVHGRPGAGLAVFHLEGDDATTCATFVRCLSEVRDWSESHRGHVPVFVLVEPKHDAKSTVDGSAVDAEIRSVFKPEQLLTPDDVQGDAPSLREAIVERGWPLLGSVRNKVVVVFADDVATRSSYTANETSLRGRAMFVYSDPSSPLAAFMTVPDARVEGARIDSLVRAGYIVRTRADANGVEALANDSQRAMAALASGAQLVSTDYPVAAPSGYIVSAPGTPARCNPVTVPPNIPCTPDDVEKLG